MFTDQALDDLMKQDAAFAEGIKKLGIVVPRSPVKGIIEGRSPTNWVWHHDTGAGIMQLVPKSQHFGTKSPFWKTMHPTIINGRNAGGGAIWGKIKP